MSSGVLALNIDATEKLDLGAALKEKYGALMDFINSWAMPWTGKRQQQGVSMVGDDDSAAPTNDYAQAIEDRMADATREAFKEAQAQLTDNVPEVLLPNATATAPAASGTAPAAFVAPAPVIAPDIHQHALEPVSDVPAPKTAPAGAPPAKPPTPPVATGFVENGPAAGDWKTIRDPAADWAKQRGATLVKSVSETTRAKVRSIVEAGIKDGKSGQQIANDLQAADSVFGAKRALTIANTEMAFADTQGTLMAMKDAGVQKKKWLITGKCCDVCLGNNAAGEIPFDDDFPSGDFAPPGHPNCRCAIAPGKKQRT